MTNPSRDALWTLSSSVAIAALVAACGGDGAEPYDVRIDTFNIGLAGAFVPYEAERRAPLVDAIAAMDSDIVCVQEVWAQSDKDRIIEAARTTFPHSVAFMHDLDTPIDDPADQNGNVPPAPMTPPCGGSLETTLDAALTCFRDNCSTIPGSDEGHTTSSSCAEEMCIDAVTTLLLGNADSLQCYACLATSLPTESFGDMRQLCTTQPNATLAFRGQSGVMILSKHPIRDSEAHVLPGTWNRRIIASATVELPNGRDVDVYCNHLTPVFDSLAFPYTGSYGNDQVGADGWAAEQLLQADKLIAYVAARSGDRPAFVLGDMNTGRAYMDVLVDEAPATLDVLESAFTPAVAADFVPRCTYCPDNPNVSDTSAPVWIDHIFMRGLDAAAVQSTELTFTEATVSTADGNVALSDHYGLRSIVTVE